MALAFVTASQQRVSLGTNKDILRDATEAAVMGWAKPNGTGNGGLIQMSVGGATAPSRLTIEVQGGIWICAARRLDGDAATTVNGPVPVAGVWIHLAAVARFNSGGLDLYVDGAFYATTANGAWTANSSNTASGVAHIGSEDDGLSNWFDGTIDDCRIYVPSPGANGINTIYRARGADNILLGLGRRWTFTEATTGVAAAGAASVRDKGRFPLPGTAVNSPVYAGALAIHRRKRRAA